MERKTGIWVDHRQAVLVFLENEQTKIKVIESNVGPRYRLAGGSRSSTPYGPQDAVSESKRDQKYLQQLRLFYQGVVEELRDSDSALILGPGEAKNELKKAIQKSAALRKIPLTVETADKMTQKQIVARVKTFFSL